MLRYNLAGPLGAERSSPRFRTATHLELESLDAKLQELAVEVRNMLETHLKSQNTSANESQTERHIQNSKSESNFEFEPGFREDQARPPSQNLNQTAHRQRDTRLAWCCVRARILPTTPKMKSQAGGI